MIIIILYLNIQIIVLIRPQPYFEYLQKMSTPPKYKNK